MKITWPLHLPLLHHQISISTCIMYCAFHHRTTPSRTQLMSMLRIKAISTPRFGDPIRPSLPNQTLHRRPWKAIVHFSQPVLKPLFCVLSFVACANVLAGQATRPDSIQSQPGFHVELLHSATAEQGSWISMTFDDQDRLILGIDKQV